MNAQYYPDTYKSNKLLLSGDNLQVVILKINDLLSPATAIVLHEKSPITNNVFHQGHNLILYKT